LKENVYGFYFTSSFRFGKLVVWNLNVILKLCSPCFFFVIRARCQCHGCTAAL